MKAHWYTTTLTLLLVACIYPTDKGGELRIEVALIARMIRGDSVKVEARLLGPDGTPVPNARFVYSSEDKSVAVVTTDGLVIAANAGSTTITVWSVGSAGTPPAQAQVAVSGTVSVDSVRPIVAKWGQALSVYGSGLALESGEVVTIDDVPVSITSYHPDDPTRPERFGVLQVLITPPLQTGGREENVNVVVTTPRGAGALLSALTVEPVDIYEPNTFAPADLGTITGPREFLGLAMEAANLDIRDIDWYTFTTAVRGDWTIELRVPEELSSDIWSTDVGADLTFFPAGALEADLIPNPGWFFGPFMAYYPGRGSSAGSLSLCRGRGAWFPYLEDPLGLSSGFVSHFRGITTLRNVPAGRHDLLVNWASFLPAYDASFGYFPNRRPNQWSFIFLGGERATTAVRYDLFIRPGVVSGPVPADAYEPNDFCEDARPLLTLGAVGFTDSVLDATFDGPLDEDWFTLDVQQAGLLQVRYSPDSTVFGELVTADPDSAVRVGDLGGGSLCGLTSLFAGSCVMEEALLQSGSYHLLMNPFVLGLAPYLGPYQLVFSWAPSAALGAPQVRRP